MSKNSWVKPLGKEKLDKWRKLLSKRKEYDYVLQAKGREEEAEEVKQDTLGFVKEFLNDFTDDELEYSIQSLLEENLL